MTEWLVVTIAKAGDYAALPHLILLLTVIWMCKQQAWYHPKGKRLRVADGKVRTNLHVVRVAAAKKYKKGLEWNV